MKGFPVAGEHVVEDVPAQLLYPVLDHPVGNQDTPHRVRVVIGDTEEAGAIPWSDPQLVIFGIKVSLYLHSRPEY